mgnify:CR=1 FL=1
MVYEVLATLSVLLLVLYFIYQSGGGQPFLSLDRFTSITERLIIVLVVMWLWMVLIFNLFGVETAPEKLCTSEPEPGVILSPEPTAHPPRSRTRSRSRGRAKRRVLPVEEPVAAAGSGCCSHCGK